MASDTKKVISDKKEQAKRLMTDEQRKACNIAIHTAAVASGAAGVVPLPAVDAIPITAAQVTMVLALGKVFEQEVSESVAKGLISAAASTFVGRNLVKVIPIIGWGVSAAVAAGVTEAIGWTVAVDFAKNAKNVWEKNKGTTSSHEPADQESNGDSSLENDVDEKEKHKQELMERADMFLSGKKRASENSEELNVLIADFVKILDSLPKDDPLVKIYDDLCCL